MALRLAYEDQEVIVPDGSTAVIGSDPDATVRIARPGISRRHVVAKSDGGTWKIQDASSRNGTYHEGARIQSLDIAAPTTIVLGHPTDGASIALSLMDSSPNEETTKVVPVEEQPTPDAEITTPGSPAMTELEDLIGVLRDTVSSIKSLTWSVWAMIAVTAVLAVLTLFVAVIGT